MHSQRSEQSAPLLLGVSDGQPRKSDADSAEDAQRVPQQTARVGWQFVSALAGILRFLRPWTAAILSALAVLEILVFAQVGRITGSYYRILLDKEWSAFWRVTSLSAALYVGAVALRSTTTWLSEMLAVRWREVLTAHLQQRYMSKRAYFSMTHRCDNPDQRIVQDVTQLCSVLALICRKLAATPFKTVFYGCWVARIASWPVPLIVAAFFAAGLGVQRCIMNPVAAIVCQQELLEGNLRFAQMRIRYGAEQIAIWGGEAPEFRNARDHLAAAVLNQRRLVFWRWLLNAATFALDYAGAVLNFICVALPVATGAFGEAGDSGETAQKISNASFATLSLIYSLTEVLDLSDSLSTLAGLTARVADLQQAFNELDACPRSAAATAQAGCVGLPRSFLLGNGGAMEVSIHVLPADLRQLVAACFPDVPDSGSLLAVCTVQSIVQEQDEQAMAGRLHNFLRWQDIVTGLCRDRGFWAVAADPATGFSLRGPSAGRWNEVQLAHRLLGHPVVDADGLCPLLAHPTYGTSAYLGSLLTVAPFPVLQAAVHRAEAALSPQQFPLDFREHGAHEDRRLLTNQSQSQLLLVEELICHTAEEQMIVQRLSFSLGRGEQGLLLGPSGVGKSTLLRALQGLWPCQATRLELPEEVMFVPQAPWVAPGPSLREQLVYPSAESPPPQLLRGLLQDVQLSHLLKRVHSDWEQPNDWRAQLSLGEQQRLAFARVLFAKPQLAVMDEPINALSPEQGALLLGLLTREGIAVLCTGQLGSDRQNLEFKFVISLDGQGSYRLQADS